MSRRLLVAGFLILFMSVAGAYSASAGSNPAPAASTAPVQPAANLAVQGGPSATAPQLAGTPVQVQPYRTFVEFLRYNMENNGEPSSPISNVRLAITFPNANKLALPEGNAYWPIGNGQAQEIHRVYEVPFSYIVNDGFKFTVQMERKGSPMLPCEFDVVQLSQFNRAYTCHTDLTWQQNQNTPEANLDKEGIQIRIFTSKNSEPKEIPTDALALK